MIIAVPFLVILFFPQCRGAVQEGISLGWTLVNPKPESHFEPTQMQTPALTPSPTPTPHPTQPPVPTPTFTPTVTPTTAPSPTPTPFQRNENEVRETLISLGGQAMERGSSSEHDAKLEKVVRDSLLYGQFDLALWAARNGVGSSKTSSMLADVAYCIAIEGGYEWARYIAKLIPLYAVEQQTLNKIFDLEHRSLRETPPPSCRKVPWLTMPN